MLTKLPKYVETFPILKICSKHFSQKNYPLLARQKPLRLAWSGRPRSAPPSSSVLPTVSSVAVGNAWGSIFKRAVRLEAKHKGFTPLNTPLKNASVRGTRVSARGALRWKILNCFVFCATTGGHVWCHLSARLSLLHFRSCASLP